MYKVSKYPWLACIDYFICSLLRVCSCCSSWCILLRYLSAILSAFAAIVSEAATDREPGHVSDESMSVDFQRIKADREKINITRDFYLKRTVDLRRPHNCSDSVPESYRHVLAPEGARDPTYSYNATEAAISREVLGSTVCVVPLLRG